MQTGRVSATDWDAREVTCGECRKMMQASSLGRHLVDVHDIYWQAVVSEELLEERDGVMYKAEVNGERMFSYLNPHCHCVLNSG
jgi:hypothetical protein